MDLVPLPVVIPLFAAALIGGLSPFAGRKFLDLLATLCAAVVLVADLLLYRRVGGGVLVYWFGGWRPLGFPLGICFAVDHVGTLLALLVALLMLFALVYSWRHFHAQGHWFHLLMMIFLASMSGFCLSGDLFNMFVFFELMGVAAYALTGFKLEDTGPLEGGLNFAVMNSLGGIFLLAGISLVYSRTGALNLAQAGKTLAAAPADYLILFSFALLVIGFFVKGAVFPFHFWLPDAHSVAPTPVSVLFSGVMVELGLYAVARIYWTVFRDCFLSLQPLISAWLCTVGGVTATVGGIMALLQRHLKRLLAFSTVSHAGIIAGAFGLLTREGAAGGVVYLLGHGLVKSMLFFCTGILLHRRGSVDEETLRGRGGALRVTAVLFLVGGAALAGLPPFATWEGKLLVERAAQGHPWVTATAVAGAVCTAAAVLRAAGGVFWGLGRADAVTASAPSSGDREQPETDTRMRRTPLLMWGPPALLLLLALTCGPLLREVGVEAAWTFTNTAGYRAAVLDAMPAVSGAVAVPAASRVHDIVAGVVPSAAAALLALLFLFSHRFPPWLKSGGRFLFQGATFLRSVHSGYVGDYVLWFLGGSAATVTLLFII